MGRAGTYTVMLGQVALEPGADGIVVMTGASVASPGHLPSRAASSVADAFSTSLLIDSGLFRCSLFRSSFRCRPLPMQPLPLQFD